MKRTVNSLLLSALLIFCLGCEKKPETVQQRPQPARQAPPDTLRYECQRFQRSYVSDDSLQQSLITLLFVYPRFTAGVADSLNAFIKALLCQSIYDNARTDSLGQVFDQMKASYQSLQADFPEYNTPWELQRRVAVIHNTKALISLRLAEVVFTGGAHPNQKRTYYSLTQPQNRVLALNDILADPGAAELKRIAEQEFRRSKNLLPDTPLDQAGFWFDGNQFQLPDNWALTDKGLLFYYNPYEIAAYNQGPIRLVLPYGRIKPLLKPAFLP